MQGKNIHLSLFFITQWDLFELKFRLIFLIYYQMVSGYKTLEISNFTST